MPPRATNGGLAEYANRARAALERVNAAGIILKPGTRQRIEAIAAGQRISKYNKNAVRRVEKKNAAAPRAPRAAAAPRATGEYSGRARAALLQLNAAGVILKPVTRQRIEAIAAGQALTEADKSAVRRVEKRAREGGAAQSGPARSNSARSGPARSNSTRSKDTASTSGKGKAVKGASSHQRLVEAVLPNRGAPAKKKKRGAPAKKKWGGVSVKRPAYRWKGKIKAAPGSSSKGGDDWLAENDDEEQFMKHREGLANIQAQLKRKYVELDRLPPGSVERKQMVTELDQLQRRREFLYINGVNFVENAELARKLKNGDRMVAEKRERERQGLIQQFFRETKQSKQEDIAGRIAALELDAKLANRDKFAYVHHARIPNTILSQLVPDSAFKKMRKNKAPPVTGIAALAAQAGRNAAAARAAAAPRAGRRVQPVMI